MPLASVLLGALCMLSSALVRLGQAPAAVSATGARLAVSGSGGAGGLMSGGVWVSIDAGQTWTAQLIDRSYQALAMSLAD